MSCSFVRKTGVDASEVNPAEKRVLDPLFVTLWGEEYEDHPDYKRDVLDPLSSGRALAAIKADLSERIRTTIGSPSRDSISAGW